MLAYVFAGPGAKGGRVDDIPLGLESTFIVPFFSRLFFAALSSSLSSSNSSSSEESARSSSSDALLSSPPFSFISFAPSSHSSSSSSSTIDFDFLAARDAIDEKLTNSKWKVVIKIEVSNVYNTSFDDREAPVNLPVDDQLSLLIK